MPVRLAVAACLLSFSPGVQAMGQFPTPIEKGPLTVAIEEFAVLPDSSSGAPARMSVMTSDPVGRLFVNDQRGPLYTVSPDGATVTEYLDLRDFNSLRITSSSEKGFQGFDFHPDFYTDGAAGFGKFYTIHSSNDRSRTPDFDPGGNSSFHTLLLEWSTNAPASNIFVPADVAAPYREVMRLDQPFSNHNAGLIAFNTTAEPGEPDRNNLYIAIGDGGNGGDPQENGQDAGNPYAAILRIDPTGTNSVNGRYGIVADNVLAADDDDGTLAEIYAYGLRNPQRFGWDAATGDMYIADIGQNAVEEIDRGVNGGNFGWDQREGSFRFEGDKTAGMIDPVAEYDHSNPVSDLPSGITGGRAVTLGEVARGTRIAGLDGNLLLGDLPTGLIFYLNVDTDPLDGGQDGLAELITLDDSGDPVRLIELINDTRADRGLGSVNRADLRFSLGIDGEVYILNKRDGVIRRLTAVPGSAVEGLVWRTDFTGDWATANWTPDGAATRVAPVGGERMVVDSATGRVDVGGDLTATPAAALSIAETTDGTVDISAAGTLVVTGNVTVGANGQLTVDGILNTGGGSVAGTLAGNGTINVDPIGAVTVTGTVAPGGDDIGTLTLGTGAVELDAAATVDAQVSLAATDPPTSDQLFVSASGTLHLGGTLAVTGTGRTDADGWETGAVRRVVDNTAGGTIGDGIGGGESFATIEPASTSGVSSHAGQGAFLRDVIYTSPAAGINGVDVELFIALGGDADGDKKVWLSDWAALRANFGNTGTGKTWTEGNFDPWRDGMVWLSDWAALRANFGNSDYTLTEGAAAVVPEPGTIAMLLGGLAGLALAARRRRA